MGQVIGPFTKDDFYTMKQLKEDLKFLKKNLKEAENSDIAIKRVEKILKKYTQRELQEAA